MSADLLAVALRPELRAYGSDTVSVVFVTVRDSDGVEATGFTYTLGIGAGVVCRMVEDVIAPLLIGCAADDWPAVSARIAAGTRRLGMTVFVPALSAVDIAIWDLRGKQQDQPLYRLLGAAPASPVPIYGSGRGSNGLTLDKLIEHTGRYRAKGYPAVKLRAGARSPEQDLARLAAVRDSVGPDYRLMVDCNEQLTLADALWFGHRLAELDYYWLEEPLPAEDVRGHAELAAKLPIAIAVGEHLPTVGAFLLYLSETAVAMYQPDAALGGGITELLRLSQLLDAAGKPISYHSVAELHIHLAVAAPGAVYVEDFPILASILGEQLPLSDGTVLPSERPGHGMVWDLEAIARARVS